MRALDTAIITGPTGAIGLALCRCLSERGIAVHALVNPAGTRGARVAALPGVHVVPCGLDTLRALPELLAGVRADAFFHLAWAGTTGAGRNDMLAQTDNIRYTVDAVRAAKALGCAVFVGAGSQAEYGLHDGPLSPVTPCFPENGYGMAKLCAGQMSRLECARLGIDHIWPRILSVYGPGDGAQAMIPQVIRKLLAGEKPALTAGEQLWDYLYADDAAEALWQMALCGRHGAVYPLGSGRARPLRETIGILRDAIDPALPLGFGEVPYGEKQVMRLEADISALRRDTGWQPRTDFEVGIRNTIAYIREHPNG